MQKIVYKCYLMTLLHVVTIQAVTAQVSSLSEDFTTVLPTNWVANNLSSPANPAGGWQQGNSTVFNAYNGAANSFAAANFESIADPPGSGTISNWLITPVLNLTNGAIIKFYTRKATPDPFDFADRMEVRLSKNGSSTNVGTTATGVGDFTSLLITINPNLSEGGYPTEWREYSFTLTNITAGQTGRIAFRYFVTDGGINGQYSDYIGLDNVSYDALLPVNITNFTASLQETTPVLQWSVTNESNMIGYDIEKSVDGINFSYNGFIAAKNSGTATYSFSDKSLSSGTVYYRLKQRDKDGTTRYSSIKSLQVISAGNWKLINNMPGQDFQIALSLTSDEIVQMQIVNAVGAVVYRQQFGKLGAGTHTLKPATYPATHGVYYVQMLIGKQSSSQKIVR